MMVAVAAQATPAPTQEEKLVCKRIDDNSTGWRVQKMRKVCRTAAEWRALDDETQRAIGKAKDKGMFDPNGIPKGR
jgi:hypothetical protein